VKACSDCDILVFVTPHQFLAKTCEQLVGHVKPNAVGVSLVKVYLLLVISAFRAFAFDICHSNSVYFHRPTCII